SAPNRRGRDIARRQAREVPAGFVSSPTRRPHVSRCARRMGPRRTAGPPDRRPRRAELCLLYLDLDVDAGGQLEALERVDRLGARLQDVEQALVDAHLEVLAAVLVLVRRADDRVAVLLGRQRDRPPDGGLRTQDRLDDLAGRLVDDLVVVRLQPDADLLLVSHLARFSRNTTARSDQVGRAAGHYLMILVTRPEATVRPPSRMAKRRPSSMAMGAISSAVIDVLSPGMHISVPSGNVIAPVTSVVRK